MAQEENAAPLITNEMIGYMIAFGLDFVLLAGILWLVDVVSGTVFVSVTGLVIGVYAVWISWRWYSLRSSQSTEADPIETVKQRYAEGDLSEKEFEKRLTKLMTSEQELPAGDLDSEELQSADEELVSNTEELRFDN